MVSNSASIKNIRPFWIFMLTALAVFSAVFVWRGAEKVKKMQTETASNAQFAQLKTGDTVLEVSEADDRQILGKLLERQDDTHYTRIDKQVQINWSASTAIVMGKASDVRTGAVIHVTGHVTGTGTVAADRGVQAQQIVILTGYVQVK